MSFTSEEYKSLDYEFYTDALSVPVATFSMEHESLGRWLTDELGSNIERIEAELHAIFDVESGVIKHKEFHGADFVLRFEKHDAYWIGHVFGEGTEDDIPENTELNDNAFDCECGLQDYKAVLLSWYQFVSGK